MAYLGLAHAANNAVQQHYAEVDRQKEQDKRDTLFNQQQEQYQYGLSQRPIQEQETQMRLNQMRQSADAAGAPLFLKAMNGDPTALKQYNDLHPDDPHTLTPDPQDPTGDTFIVTGKDGSVPVKKSHLDALYNTQAAERDFKSGMEMYKTNADLNLEAQKAKDARDLEKTKAGLKDAKGGDPKDANKVLSANGQWITEGELRQQYNQRFGKFDPILQQYTIQTDNVPPFAQWRDQNVAPQYKWGSDQTGQQGAMSYKDALDRAAQEADDKAGYLTTDSQDFGAGGRQAWITNRAQQFMQGGQSSAPAPLTGSGLSSQVGTQAQSAVTPTQIPSSIPTTGNGAIDWRQFINPPQTGQPGTIGLANPSSQQPQTGIDNLQTPEQIAAAKYAASPSGQQAVVNRDIAATPENQKEAASKMSGQFGLSSTADHGKEYNRIAKTYSDVVTKINRKELPSRDELVTALQFAAGRNDQATARQMDAIIKKYYGK